MKKIKFSLLLALLPLLTASVQKPAGYIPGDKAAHVHLLNTDGKMSGFSAYPAAKGFIVIFTCNHCPFSKAYEDRIIALDKKYSPQGYQVIAINPNDSVQYPEDSYDSMKVRASEKGFGFPYLYDVTQEIAKQYGAEKTPHVFLLKSVNGEQIVQYTGAIDNNAKDAAAADQKFLENAVDELLAGKEVSVKTTKAIGCSVKWKM